MASRFWVGGTGTWDASDTTHWSATSGGAGGASVPVDGDTVTFDGSSGGGTVTLGYSPTITSITCGAFTGTLDFSTYSPTMDTFNSSGTGVRTVTMGSGTITLRGNNATIWDITTNTNLTLNAGTSTLDCTYSGSVGTRVVRTGNSSALGVYNLKISAGTDGFNIANGSGFAKVGGNLDFTGFTGTFSGTTATTVVGNLTFGAGMTNTRTGSIELSGAALQLITTNGVALTMSLSLNGSSYQLQDHLNISDSTKNITLTKGTFDANNKNVTCGIFSSSNSNTRTLTMGSGTWTLTGNAAIIWSCSTTTNMTVTGSGILNCTYSGSTGTRDFRGSLATLGATTVLVKISAGTDTISFGSSSSGVYSIDFTGFSGVHSSSGATSILSFKKDWTSSATMTDTYTAGLFRYDGTGSGTYTSNGVAINSFTINGIGGTLTLQDDLTLNSAIAFTVTNGTFNSNNKNITVAKFSSSNSNARTITLGSSIVTLTGTGTVWDTATATNLTLNRGTSTIKISDTSATAKTFSGGGQTFYNLWYANGAGGASLTFVGSNTFNSVRDTSTAAHSLIFTAGTTQTVPIGSWFVTGKSGAVTTLASTTTSAFTLTFTGVGTISSDYMSISYCTISLPDKEFFVGTHSTDGGNNTRVYFTAPTLHRSNFYLFM